MSRLAIFFLVIVTLGLAILLALLGIATMASNLLGWFMLLTGLVYFFGIAIVYWLCRIRFWDPKSDGKIVGEEVSDRSFWLIAVGMIAAFYVPPLEYLVFPAVLPRSIWMQVTGLLIVSWGSILFIWARRALGRFYSGHISIIEGQQLVQHGPYRLIRHPAYAGYLLIASGITIGYSSIAGLLVVAFVLIPSVIFRISVEDRLLAEQFGEPFQNYARHTNRLFPGIW